MRCPRRDVVPQKLISSGTCGSPSPLIVRKDRYGQRARNGSGWGGGGTRKGNGEVGRWTPREAGEGAMGLEDEGGNPGRSLPLPVL